MINFENLKTKKHTAMTTVIRFASRIAAVALVLSAIGFAKYIASNEFETSEKILEQSVQQTASNIRGRLSNSINEAKVLSLKLTNYTNTFSEEEIAKFLSQQVNATEFRRIIFVDLDGKTIRYQKGEGRLPSTDWSEDERFTETMGVDSFYTAFKKELSAPSGYVNEFGVPVRDSKNNVVGMLAVQGYADSYVKALGFNNFNKQGASYIIDNNLNFIIKPEKDSLALSNFLDPDKLEIIGATKEEIKEQIGTQDVGAFVFKLNGKKYLAAFAIVDKNERYILTVVPMQVITLHIGKLLWGLIAISFIIGILLIIISNLSCRFINANEKKVYELAFIDPIIKNKNRNRFNLEAEEILKQDNDDKYALISISIDKFDAIKQMYGTDRANRMLYDVFEIIEKAASEGSICAKDNEEDCFIVLYKYEKEDFISKYFIQKAIDEVKAYNEDSMLLVSSEGMTMIDLTLSFGVSTIKSKADSINLIAGRAYIARKSIKTILESAYQFYDEVLMAQTLQKKAFESEMRYALSDNQFKAYLQPKYDLKTKRLVGAEALARWIHPERGTILPTQFIPIFEKNGFIIQMDKCIWSQACEFLSNRKKKGLPLVPVSINVSRLHFNNSLFVDELVQMIKKYELEPWLIEIEITESACFDNHELFEATFNQLRKEGFAISMDDFGTGFSSLSMLRQLPINVLKLDKEFIQNAIGNTRGQIVTESIIAMANRLNMTTIAEGIENKEQEEFLKEIDCQIVQGFLYGQPVDTEQFEKLYM